ncbi:hypothetical protein IQ254_02310 [Nodosilinea sp. LEGE 07088]|uniref:hypothetical protein n=1 Tax=Nodosilinea sp. LEGE 07088 TaxID=2777968 RepID=UPI00187FB667|nr:hypothetical protein [Nodosilinea sp. LEGE 07088]MBE9136045.1 hypothetical protein [Nodosilinea sp. LEGE 07088]
MLNEPLGENDLPSTFTLPTYQPDRLTHILLGDYAAVIEAINRMEVLRYCARVAWIDPIPTGRSGEYISVMTRRITPAED